MDKSRIEWTDSTWNPVTGCTKISPGCQNCYACRMALRLQAMGVSAYSEGFQLRWHEQALSIPSKWSKPRMIFVNSMSDLFHEDLPVVFIQKIFDVMNNVKQHTYQVLTKRAERLLELSELLTWTPNIWMGVTVENQDYVSRIDCLRSTKAAVKFLSLEPLLGPIHNLDLRGINWVIVGGESGPKARPMNPEWVYEIQKVCKTNHVPFFFKQWGGVQKKRNGRLLNGRTYDEMPSVNNSTYELELV